MLLILYLYLPAPPRLKTMLLPVIPSHLMDLYLSRCFSLNLTFSLQAYLPLVAHMLSISRSCQLSSEHIHASNHLCTYGPDRIHHHLFA